MVKKKETQTTNPLRWNKNNSGKERKTFMSFHTTYYYPSQVSYRPWSSFLWTESDPQSFSEDLLTVIQLWIFHLSVSTVSFARVHPLPGPRKCHVPHVHHLVLTLFLLLPTHPTTWTGFDTFWQSRDLPEAYRGINQLRFYPSLTTLGVSRYSGFWSVMDLCDQVATTDWYHWPLVTWDDSEYGRNGFSSLPL